MFPLQASLVLLIFTAWFCPVQAVIIEIMSIDEIAQHVDDTDILVFDIDNVTAYPTSGVGGYGSDEWWMELLNTELACGLNFCDAVTKHLPRLEKAYMTVDLQPVEAHASTVIRHFQDRSIATIALTARSAHFAERTMQQLAAIEIDFAAMALMTKDIHEHLIPEKTRYHNGMFFCGVHDKGKSLTTLLDATGFVPTKVVFIDDKRKNLENVERAMQERNIPFIGLRYGYLDRDVELFKNGVTAK